MSEYNFRGLLKRMIEKIEDNTYTLQTDPDLSLNGDKLKTMDGLVTVFEKSLRYFVG
jgi:hypothetical protein